MPECRRPPLLYRACLRLLPGEFRRRHAATMTQELLEERAETGDGFAAGARFWARACIDVLSGSAPAWRRTSRRSAGGLGAWRRDIAFGIRGLRREPAVTGLCLLSIALGIGANGAVFTVVNEILLRPMAVEDPATLAVLHIDQPGADSFAGFSLPELMDYRETAAGIASMAGTTGITLALGESMEVPVVAALVSAGYFELFGVRPAIGRAFTAHEAEVGGSDPLAVISHGLWQRQFGGDAGILGTRILLGGRPFTVIGVMPASFSGPFIGFPVEVWAPLIEAETFRPGERLDARTSQPLEVFIRRSPGTSMRASQEALNVVAARLELEYPDTNRHRRVWLSPLTGIDDSLRGGVVGFLGILMALSALVLLTACLNVGNLLLSRGQSRRGEIATRMALGAGRSRVVRQLLTETLVLFLLGSGLAVALAWQINGGLRRFIDSLPIPLGLQLELDPVVLGMTALAALSTAIATGLSPALRATRESHADVLRSSRSGDRRAIRLRQAFVIAQVAVSLVLLTAAGLFLRALERGQRLDPGFATAGLSFATVGLPVDRYTAEEARTLFAALETGLVAPGNAVALSQSPPLGVGRTPIAIQIPGRTPPEGRDAFVVDGNVVSARYFETVGVEIVRGRAIDEADVPAERRVAVVNERLAAMFGDREQALHQQFLLQGREVEIVGIARDTRYLVQVEEPGPMAYLPLAQHPQHRLGLVIRSDAPAAAIARTIADHLHRLDATLAPPGVRALTELIDGFLLPQRVAARVAGALGLVGLVLAVSGVYGIVTYSLGQRRRELAIRMALGGEQAQLTRLVLRSAVVMVGTGTAIGLAGAALLGASLRGFLVGLTPFDPLTLTVAAAGLFGAALVAAWVPARRAARIAPAEALRQG